MDYLQQCLDLRRQAIEPERFAMASAVRYLRGLIRHSGNDLKRPDLESALLREPLEPFLARAAKIGWKNARLTQEWLKVQQLLPRVREVWEKGQRLFQEALKRAKSHQESMEYRSQIDFVADSYAYVAALNTYPRDEALQNWVIHGYMLAWRADSTKVGL